MLHIEVVNPQLNPGRNILTVTIVTDPSVVNSKFTRVKVFALRLNYIVVGSAFEGFYNDLPSSYVFARNGNLDRYQGGVGPNAINN